MPSINGTSTYDIVTDVSASTTLEHNIPKIDWDKVFMSHEKELEHLAKEEIKRQKEIKLRLNLKRKSLFTKKRCYQTG